MRPVVLAASTVLALLTGAADALAQAPPPHPARLTYVRSPGAGACPEEWLFRTMVAGHLGGADPFVENAPRRVAVTFQRSSRGGYAGVVKLYDAQEKERASEPWAGRTCIGVAENITTIVVSWLIPLDGPPKPAPEPPPRCEPAPPPALPTPACTPAPPARKPDPPASPGPRVVVELGSLVSFATVPRRAGFGVVAGIGARWTRFSLGLEVRADLPSSTDPLPGATPPTFGSAWLFSNTLVPCLHVGAFVGCGLVSGGVLTVDATAALPFTQVHPYAALGARIGLELPLSTWLALCVSADLLVPLLHFSTVGEHGTIWTQPPVGGDLGLRLVTTFGGP